MAHNKTEMAKTIILLLASIFPFTIYGQEQDSSKRNKIDFIVSTIPEYPTKADSFEIIQSSGLISRKIFLVFNKRIGNFHEDAIYKNDEIKLIRIFTQLNNTSSTEDYYFDNDELIRYDREIRKFDKNILISKNKFSAYFDSDRLIGATDIDDVNPSELLTKSYSKLSDWKEFLSKYE